MSSSSAAVINASSIVAAPSLSGSGVLAGGVDFALPGNGGPHCRDHVPWEQRQLEFMLAALASLSSFLLSRPFDNRRRRGDTDRRKEEGEDKAKGYGPAPWHSMAFLLTFTFVYGIEVRRGERCCQEGESSKSPCYYRLATSSPRVR